MYPRIVNCIKKAIEDKKGEDIAIYNVKKTNTMFDYVIICSSMNERNMNAISTSVEEELAKNEFAIKNIEGRNSPVWIVVDCYDVIVHIMDRDYRKTVKLDDLQNKK